MKNAIHKSIMFNVDGSKTYFTAGIKANRPVVVFGVKNPPAFSAIAVATLEYPMETLEDAVIFVDQATQELAVEALSKVTADKISVGLNEALSADIGHGLFVTRKQAGKF
ncbi:MAG: hypothetical protein ACRC6N_11365 [Plesiomonas sp.]|uniref:hypothetical protein n=1 Tax=Plesiomonas sp. TaxID=2486279 RepID=UPI003F2CEFFE